MKNGEIFSTVTWEVLIFNYGKNVNEKTWRARISSDDAAKIGFNFFVECGNVFGKEKEAKTSWLDWKKKFKVKKYRFVEKEEW